MFTKYSYALLFTLASVSEASNNALERNLPAIPANPCTLEISDCMDDAACMSCYETGTFPEKDGPFATCDDLLTWLAGVQFEDPVQCDYNANNELLANVVYCLFDIYAYEGDIEACVPAEPEACSNELTLCMEDDACKACYENGTIPAKQVYNTCQDLLGWLNGVEFVDYINCDYNFSNPLLGGVIYCLYDSYAVENNIIDCAPDTTADLCSIAINECLDDEDCKFCYETGTIPAKDSTFETCSDLVAWLSGVTFDDLVTCDYNVVNPLLAGVIYCLHDSYAVEDDLVDCIGGLTPFNPGLTNAPTMAPTMSPTMAPTEAATAPPTMETTMKQKKNN
mmetsp:Transcript_6382/g.9566  ORF Transcript_6382/g.9566 Transcript_6382/m.9566 type:complete len:337 (-) Transcript_6382:133-1143(-)